ncbi:AmmeMemoRadiSam system radical SAM enzyme [candidate division KSB1 bacterium]
MMPKKLTRRKFLKDSLLSLPAVCTAAVFDLNLKNLGIDDDDRFVKEARYYEKLPDKKIVCKLCPRECEIDDLERGYCGVRENRGGKYYTLVYSRPCSIHADPIEKKPLYHFLPGTTAFSIATVGCNVECKFCQNWEISQMRPEQVKAVYAPPDLIAESAKRNNCASIAYTYSEPVIFYEYMYDTAVEGRKKGIKSVIISNGYINQKPLDDLLNVLDGVKIDLKAFTDRFYKELVMGKLKPVLDTLVLLKKRGVWFEIVYLMIPEQNDKPEEIRELAKWIKSELGGDVPVHFSRYYPMYKLKNIPPTPVKTLETAKEICDAEGLNFVYLGNVPIGHKGGHTYCPKCKSVVIQRLGYSVNLKNFEKGRCSKCNTTIPGVWQ